MNSKKSREIRRLLKLDLSGDSEQRLHGCEAVGKGLIAQIQPDGKHTEREVEILEARTTTDRYLYRKLKKIYSNKKNDNEVKEQLLEDLHTNSAASKK